MSSTGGDDERTIVRPPSKRAAVQLGHTLPPGTRLRDYEISGLIGEGGFGIVYLAWDHSLQRKVAVKEYMPASMASRVSGSSAIVVKSERHVDTFRAGLRSFVNEARLLARFDHPSLVKVYRFWEENGTAYMVMPFYEGPTLKAALAELGHVPSEAELRAWLRPLLDALAVMHAAQCYHRDIAPDNILLTPSGPLLLDFGAARRVIGDMTHALTVVLKPGYAPIEQYGDVATMAQGAWTDLYALACVVYFAITGKTPMSSVERLMDDRLEPLAVAAAGRYSPAFLGAIDHALAVRPQDRPQNERQFRDLLDADLPPDAVAAPPRPAPHPQAFPRTVGEAVATVPATLMPVLATELLPRDVIPLTLLQTQSPPPFEGRPSDTAPFAATDAPFAAPVASPRSSAAIGVVVVAALLLVGAAAGVYLWMQRPADSTAPVIAAPASMPAPTAVQPTVPMTALPPALTIPEPLAASAPAPAAAPTPEAVIAPPIEPPAATPSPVLPAASAAPPRPRREPSPRTDPVARSEPVAPPRRSNGVRCSDILQKASLEPLTADEAAYLKRECR